MIKKHVKAYKIFVGYFVILKSWQSIYEELKKGYNIA
jgi:hypothetical protein